MASHEFIGVDVAMDWIDVCYLSNGRHERIKSTKQSLAKFAKAANDAVVVLEASGGYERPLIEALIKASQVCFFERWITTMAA
jgi:transposase